MYQNKTKKIFKEDLTLKLKNLMVVLPQNVSDMEPLSIMIQAGGEFFVSLRAIDGQNPTSYSMSKTFKLL